MANHPKFDLVYEHVSGPVHIALGWDKITGAAYRGLVEVDSEGVIGKILKYEVIPYYFDINDKPHAEFYINFLVELENHYKQTA